MAYAKLGRNTGHRKAMLRNLVTSLLRDERITTTESRAKEIKRIAEKMITLAKKGDLNARRQALEYIFEEKVARKLFDNYGPKYADRQGGYTRIIRIGYRRGDAAQLVLLELV